jgi:hypothetical protein
MSWKLNTEDENPLWRQYMDELEKMNPEESIKWEVVRELPVELPFNTTTTSNYSEDEFLEKLKTDKEFNKRWGKFKNS